MSLANVCRICANTIRDEERARNIFCHLRGKLQKDLKVITGVTLKPNAELPERACERCTSELELAMKFRERCIFSQKYLVNLLKRKDEQCFNETIITEDVVEEEDVPANIGNLELELLETQKEEEFSIEQTNVDQVVYADEFETVVAVEPEGPEEDTHPAQEQLAMLLNESRHTTQPQQQFYICDQCGQFVSEKSRFRDHLENHIRKKRKYECFECSEIFINRNIFKQHKLDHATERRHKCATCGERFADHGAKLRHEKAHQNERPHPCLECGQTFNSTAKLRLHLATHTSPARKFRCEPCNEDFSDREDLLEHSKTTEHMQSVQQMQNEIALLCAEDDDNT